MQSTFPWNSTRNDAVAGFVQLLVLEAKKIISLALVSLGELQDGAQSKI